MSASSDARYRTKLFLDTYLVAATMTEDDAVTLASYRVMYAEPRFPLEKLFLEKEVDIVFAISTPKTTPLFNADHTTYAYEEEVPITIYVLYKPNYITPAKVIWKAEYALRVAAQTYPTGSLRTIRQFTDKTAELGGMMLYGLECVMSYKRSTEVIPTKPKFSMTHYLTIELDRLSGGIEGTWTEQDGAGSTCATMVTAKGNFQMYQSVFNVDSYIETETGAVNLGISQAVYPYVRFRYKTSYSSTAKIILVNSDATTQTVLAETASATYTTVSVALTAGKTVDHIRLYNCDGTGYVFYDFLQFYAADYILPNCTEISTPYLVNDAVLTVPGRVGSIDQMLGSKSLEIRMTCDLDMEPAYWTWKRPQGASPKTDYNNIDALLETAQYGSHRSPYMWTWLQIGNPAMQFKARLVEVNPVYGEAHKAELVWREYRHGTVGVGGGSEESYETPVERWGMNL